MFMGLGFFLLLTVLFCCGFAEISCLDHEIYIFIVKKSTSSAETQSFSILADGEAVFSSPPLQDNSIVGLEACLNKTDGLHYTLQMRSTSGIWDAGSYIEIHGNYNNTFLKAYMQQKQVENIPFTLHYPIHLYSICKFISGISLQGWTVMSFDDSYWEDIPLGMVPEYRSGTQYFRIPFVVPINLVAYEIRLRYRFGVIAYIEGLEIWRDHLPSGTITNRTLATGDYGVNQFHGLIRSAEDFARTSNNPNAKIVLAMALHFPDLVARTIDFDVWIAGYQTSIPGTNCYVIPTEPAVSSSQSVINLEYLHDFNTNTWMEWSVPSSSSRTERNPKHPLHITWNYGIPQSNTNITVLPAISGIRIFTPFSSQSPSSLSVTACSPNRTHTVLSDHSFHTMNHSHLLLTTSLSRWPSSIWNLTLDSLREVVTLGEVHPLVCMATPPTDLLFPYYAYFFSPQKEEEVIIEPALKGFTQCSISPALPAGLILDRERCRIQGIAEQTISATVFTVSSVWDNPYEHSSPLQVSGSFELTIKDCKGELIEITRTFQADAAMEGFEIRDSRGNLIFEQVPHSTQRDNFVWNHYLCVNPSSNSPYYIQFHSSERSAWSSHSYLILHHVLSPSLKLFKLRVRKDEEMEFTTEKPWFIIQSWITPNSEWYYYMGTIPSEWSSDDLTGYEKAIPSFIPSSSNQLQVFKRQFSVSSSSLEMNEISGIELSLRYQYGCVIAINGHVVFSHGVELPLTNHSLAIQSYQSVQYRTITIPSVLTVHTPVSTIQRNHGNNGNNGNNSHSKPIELLRKDQLNTIAVVLISSSITQTECTFDAALSAIINSQSRVVPTITVTGEGLIGEPSSVFALDHQLVVKGQVLVEDPSILITFPEGHHETITQISLACARVQRLGKVGSFVVEGRKERIADNSWKMSRKRGDEIEWRMKNRKNTIDRGSSNAENKLNNGDKDDDHGVNEEWEEIRVVDSLLWVEQSLVHIGLLQNTPYHQYRIRAIHSLSRTSAWQISQMDLRMTKRTADSPLFHSSLPREMSFSLYSNVQSSFTSLAQSFIIAYSILPDLPEGFAVDCCTGNLIYQYNNVSTSTTLGDHRNDDVNGKSQVSISSSFITPSVFKRTAVFTADNGNTMTVPLSLELSPCSDVITISILADNHPLESSWEIVTSSSSSSSSHFSSTSIPTTTTRLFQDDVFPVGNGYFHIPVCGSDVANDFTILRVMTSREHGWDIPSGYYLSQRSIIYAMDMMPSMKDWSNKEINSSLFSSSSSSSSQRTAKKWNVREMMLNEAILLSPDIPVSYLTTSDEWLFLSAPSSSSSRWEEEVPMNALPSSSKQFTVVRVEVPAVEMINFQVIHTGEIALAANGYIFAAFDGVSTTMTSATTSTTSQMLTDYCHLIAGSVTSPILLTIRLANPPLVHLTALAPRSFLSSSSSTTNNHNNHNNHNHVNSCHLLLDSIESIHCNQPVQQPLTDLFDYHPEKMVTISMEGNTSVEWKVRNKIGTQFNAFGIFATEDRKVGPSRIFGTDATFGADQPIAVIDELSISSRELTLLPLNTTTSLSGYRQFRWTVLENPVTSTHSSQDMSAPLAIVGWMPMYCPSRRTVDTCTGSWPWSVSMGKGETRIIRCADGRGFRKRTCMANGWEAEEKNCPGERARRGWLLTIIISVIVVGVMLGMFVVRRLQKRRRQVRDDEYRGLLNSRVQPSDRSRVEAKPVV